MGGERHRLGYKMQGDSRATVVDVYPTIDRNGETSHDETGDESLDSLPPVLPSSKWWIIPRGRLATGPDFLKLMGLPTRDLDLSKTSSANMTDLAGNAFCAGSYATVVLAMMAAFPASAFAVASGSDDEAAVDLGFLKDF